MEYLALSNVSVTIGGYEECEEEHEYYIKTFKHECHQRGDSVFLNTRIYKIKQQSCPLNKIIVIIIVKHRKSSQIHQNSPKFQTTFFQNQFSPRKNNIF